MANFEGEQVVQGANPASFTPDSVATAERLSLWALGRIWFFLGIQSFGGGMATLYLIRRTAVDRYGWFTPAEFSRDWALCQAAPGINLLCMTILVGRQVAGLPGAVVALIGLLLPSVTITIVMIALYADLRNLPVVQAALHGIVPATVGLGLLLTYNMARPLVNASRQEGHSSLTVSVVILVGSALAVVVWELPVLLVLISAGLLGALSMWHHAIQTKVAQEKTAAHD
ncbi:MAG: chromate transporter [Caldilinea sp. CFX5]|nr:chromate transporter [Caldilinea sp. CFX5]